MVTQQTSCKLLGFSFSKVRVTWNRKTGYESKKKHIKYCGSQSQKHNVQIKVFRIIFKNTEESNKHQGEKTSYASCNLGKGYISCCSLKHKCALLMTLFFSIYFCWYLLRASENSFKYYFPERALFYLN